MRNSAKIGNNGSSANAVAKGGSAEAVNQEKSVKIGNNGSPTKAVTQEGSAKIMAKCGSANAVAKSNSAKIGIIGSSANAVAKVDSAKSVTDGSVAKIKAVGRAVRSPRFDREWRVLIDFLPAERRAVMTEAIRAYQIDGTEPSGLQGAELMAFRLIKKVVDRRRRQREAYRRRRGAGHADGLAVESGYSAPALGASTRSGGVARPNVESAFDKTSRRGGIALLGTTSCLGETAPAETDSSAVVSCTDEALCVESECAAADVAGASNKVPDKAPKQCRPNPKRGLLKALESHLSRRVRCANRGGGRQR